MAKKGGAGGIGRPSDLLNSMQSDGWKQRLRVIYYIYHSLVFNFLNSIDRVKNNENA